MNTPHKPSPVVNSWAQPFWDAARQERLVVQKCSDCDQHIFYPRMACPHCFSDHLDWVTVAGKGTIYSYTVVENNPPSAFLGDLPYVVAIIRLEEGVRMLANIVQCDPGELTCDLPVEVIFEKLNDEFTLPKFRLIR
jgi:hypothetical protein